MTSTEENETFQVSRQRVLHFIQSGGLYGAEHVILTLSEEMRHNSDFEPVVGCIVDALDEQSDLYDAAVNNGLKAIKLVIPNAKLPIALPKAAKLLQEEQIDLIHSHGYKPSVFGFAIRLLTGIPIIATCHLWFEMDKGPLKTRVMLWLEQVFYRWFPFVIAVSEDIRKILVEKGVAPSKVLVVENGVDPTAAVVPASVKNALRSELSLEQGTFCILNAGRLTRQKSQWTLIEAAAKLKNHYSDFRILIAGEGKLREELESLAVDYGVENHVTFLGFRKDIAELLSISQALALPSLDEGMPIALLEAVSQRIPVITTAVGDIPELIADRDSGVIIPKENAEALANALELLIRQPGMGQSLADKAHKRLEERYSSAAMYQHYRTVYEKLLTSSIA